MKPFLLLLLGLCFPGGASAEICPPIVGTIVGALQCQRDLCKDLSVANEKGVSKEGIYYVTCIQNFTFNVRSEEPFVAEIDQLQRTRFSEPPQLLSPCECLEKLAADFPECKLKTCKSEDLKPAPPEPAAPAGETPTATPTPGSGIAPVSEKAKVESAEGGCSLR